MPTYTVTSDPLTVDNAASTLVQVQNTGSQTIRILPLGRTVAPGATVTVPGWLTVPTSIHTVGGGATSTAVVTLTSGSPATAPGPGAFLVDPGAAGTLSLSITGGTWFSDEGLLTPLTFPATITGVTSIYPAAEASVQVSATVGTVTKTVGHSIRAGDGGSFTWTPTTEAERVATAVAVAATGDFDAAGAAATAQAAAIAASVQRASNLSDLASASTARTNLGLGSAATLTPAGISTALDLPGAYGRFSLPGGWQSGNAGTRRAIECVTSPVDSGTRLGNYECVLRFPFALAVPPARFRVRISTTSLTAAGTPALPVTSVYVGPATMLASGIPQVNGAFSTAPQLVDSAITLPAGGDYVSPWVTSSTYALLTDTVYMVSLGVPQLPSSGLWCEGFQAYWYAAPGLSGGTSAGVSDHAGDLAVTGMGEANQPPFDIRVEYEFADSRPVGLVLGDSRSSFYSVAPNAMPYQSWCSTYARRMRSPMINASLQAAVLTDFTTFTTGSNWRYDRLYLSSQQVDFAVVYLATNDIYNGNSLSTIQGNYQTLVNGIRATLGISRVHVMTIPPLSLGGTALLSQAQSGATAITTADTLSNGTYTLGDGVNGSETVTVSASSGTGPYTLTVGALNRQHLPNEVIYSGSEAVRRGFNQFLQRGAYATTCIDIEPTVAFAANSTKLDPRWVFTDGIHILPEGQARIAAIVPDLMS